MGTYIVMLEGIGLRVDPQSRERLGLAREVGSLGFFTTRVVDAVGVDDAIADAIQHALAELRSTGLLDGIAIGSLGEPTIMVKSVRRSSWWRATRVPTKGFTFYPEPVPIH